jgi:ankyrin repeat protein
MAIVLGNLELVKHLIERGANPLDKDNENRTVVHFAALSGRLDILKYLVEDRGCNPATGGGDVCNVLHLGVEGGNIEVVKYLVEQQHVDLSQLDKSGYLPLTYACSNKHLEIAIFLIEQMKGIEHEDFFYTENPRLPDDILRSPLCCACMSGDLSIVKYLIEKCGCDPARAESDDESKTPLISAVTANHSHIVEYLARCRVPGPAKHLHPVHTAVKECNLRIVKSLIESFHCDPNERDSNSVTPLHIAAGKGSLSIVKYLLSLKCDPNVEGSSGEQPIHFAAAHGQLALLKYLIEVGCNPSAMGENRVQPINMAAEAGYLSVFRYLCLDHGCDPLNACNGQTALHLAASSGHLDIVRFIILELKCDPTSKGKFGSPLHCAAAGGQLEVVKFLINEAGCNPNDGPGTSLLAAAQWGQFSIFEYLIENKKCDLYDEAIYYSMKSGNLSILKYLIKKLKVDKNYRFPRLQLSLITLAALFGHLLLFSYLLKIGSRLHDDDILFYAARGGNLEIVKYLVTDVNLQNIATPPSTPPLSTACMAGNVEVVKFIISEFNYNPVDILKSYPLHHAATLGHLNLVKYLIEEMKCDANSINAVGNTPLVCAAANGSLVGVEYIADPSLSRIWSSSERYLEVVKFLITITRPSLATMQDVLRMALQTRSAITALYLIVKIFYHHEDQSCAPA